MKKIIFLLAAITLFAACEKDNGGKDNEPVVEDGTYVGTVTVETPAFTMDDVKVKVTYGDDGKAEIEMDGVKFAEAMPVTLVIAIPEVTATETKDGIELSGNDIIPFMVGISGNRTPYPDRTVMNLEGTATPSALTFSMVCSGMGMEFAGTAAE